MANKRIRKKRQKAQNEGLRCTLCGKKLKPEANDYVTGCQGAVCRRCLQVSYAMTSPSEILPPHTAQNIKTPQQLMTELDRTISGQEEAKRTIALAVWKQQLRANGAQHVPSSHLLLYGPSGCGKTMLARKAAGLSGLPSFVFDATTLSEAGYRGRDAADILKDYFAAAGDHPKRDWGIVILDEIDKLSAKGGPERQAYCRGTQHTLLKLLEAGHDHDGLLFILCGAFSGLYDAPQMPQIGFLCENQAAVKTVMPEDFVAYGMEQELIGRISGFAPIHPLTEHDLVQILLEKEHSAFQVYQHFFQERGTRLLLTEDAAAQIAKRALSLGTGARALNTELDRIMEPLMLQLAEGTLPEQVEVAVDGI